MGSPAAGWFVDPTRRAGLRYWDSARWTTWVADDGVQRVDDMPPPDLPPPDVASPTGSPVTVDAATRRAFWASTRTTRWRSLNGPRTALVILLAATSAASIAVVVELANRVSVVDDLERGRSGFALVERANNADDGVQAATMAWLALLVATAIVFIVWQWRAAKNAEQREAGRFGPGWSIGGWFIPFANFVIPVLIFQDLWRASSPTSDRPRSGLVGTWWACWVAGAIIGRTVETDPSTLDGIRSADQAAMAGFALLTVAGILAIFVVVQLTRRFNTLEAREAARAATDSTPPK